MNRRLRALILSVLAAATGIAGTGIAGRQQQGSTELYGDLQEVVITKTALDARKTITSPLARRRLAVVRVPTRFMPSEAIRQIEQTVGLKPVARLPAGTYLSAALLQPPRPSRVIEARRLSDGRRPVEIAVSGSSAYAGGSRRVDVVVTSETGPGDRGRTYLAARAVPLLELRPTQQETGPGGTVAVLGLTRRQALHLIRAETYARDIRLLADLPG